MGWEPGNQVLFSVSITYYLTSPLLCALICNIRGLKLMSWEVGTLFLCWFFRMCFSSFLIGLVKYCVLLSIVFRTVKGCDLVHCLYNIYNNSQILLLYSLQPMIQSASPELIHPFQKYP
jgi:hypothetical protein